MRLSERLVERAVDGLVSLLCKVDGTEKLGAVPTHGPLILVTNHISFLEIPVLWKHLRPRRVVGLAKAEAWENPFLGRLLNMWEAIPIRRGANDITALRKSLAVLKEGRILGLAPEGTRSGDGRLQRGRSGAVTIALRGDAPLLPVAYWGGEKLKACVRRLRRTPFHFNVGEPFRIVTDGIRVTSEIRQQIVDEIMVQLAKLLPTEYHGVYADRVSSPPAYLAFDVAAP
ncbi:lysophospholipid acyltransferase family protein [Candidatus Bipolaricaulota bacterium]